MAPSWRRGPLVPPRPHPALVQGDGAAALSGGVPGRRYTRHAEVVLSRARLAPPTRERSRAAPCRPLAPSGLAHGSVTGGRAGSVNVVFKLCRRSSQWREGVSIE